ncbi:sugar ABC transporter permease [Galbitalea sp. SE-J8]|uniref:carbohydrate ABC transporter permease n=1 Tax=Galbitalea sp. SE-J8 TaxID=3054952 RepID=UPI00259CAD33|nr:sugar ABC transporter permease [Galbitalea sp. SE-J8]MDM4761665.1 sugar ABC transporter permease [Galbitalea sp. SE-J8]
MSPAGPVRRIRRTTPLRRRRTLTAYLFLAPALLVFGVFLVYPIAEGVRVSLFEYTPFGESFLGLDNYTNVFADPRFWGSLRNTAVYAVVVTTLTIAIALAIALLLNSRIGFRTFTRAVVFVPFVLSMAVVSIAFTFLLDPDIGWLSYILGKLGLPQVAYLRDPFWAMVSVIAVGIWKSVGYYMVIFLAGLQQIPKDLYEAAAVDGVNRWQRFRSVTLPLLSNTTMIVSVLTLIGGLQVFDQIFVMTGGGPYFSTESVVGYLFTRGFSDLRMGYASSIAVVFTVLIVVLSLIQIRFFNRRTVQF